MFRGHFFQPQLMFVFALLCSVEIFVLAVDCNTSAKTVDKVNE